MLIGILPLYLKIAAKERLLVVEYPAEASLVTAKLHSRLEVVGK
jgi:hypothetical protein